MHFHKKFQKIINIEISSDTPKTGLSSIGTVGPLGVKSRKRAESGPGLESTAIALVDTHEARVGDHKTKPYKVVL